MQYMAVRRSINNVVEQSRFLFDEEGQLSYSEGRFYRGRVDESLRKLGIVKDPVKVERGRFYSGVKHSHRSLTVYPADVDSAHYWLGRLDQLAAGSRRSFSLDELLGQ